MTMMCITLCTESLLEVGHLHGRCLHCTCMQGFVTGLSLAPNNSTGQGDVEAQAQELLVLADWIRFSLAGNLRYRISCI